MAHDVGLATAIGGQMFGREALQPALCEIADRKERDQVANVAWRRFSWINLAGHVAVAATWFFGRSMMSGRAVSKPARSLTVAKDALVIASLATGITTMILGRMLGARTTGARNGNAGEVRAPDDDAAGTERLRKAVGVLGIANLVANIGIVGVTAGLSMEASKSLPFSIVSRRLP
jgi:hypothetical protein